MKLTKFQGDIVKAIMKECPIDPLKPYIISRELGIPLLEAFHLKEELDHGKNI